MIDRDRDLPPELERQLRDWASSEPSIDERQLKRNLLARIPDRKPRTRPRLVFVAAAASLVVALIGIQTTRRPPRMIDAPDEVVHETGTNVILVLREGNEPIYIATERSNDHMGE
jgi:hypothetical protein